VSRAETGPAYANSEPATKARHIQDRLNWQNSFLVAADALPAPSGHGYDALKAQATRARLAQASALDEA